MYNNLEYQKTYLTGSGSVVIFAGRGNFVGFNVNTTAASTITLYDGTSPFAIISASAPIGEYVYNVIISNGLTINPAGSYDLTIKWIKG